MNEKEESRCFYGISIMREEGFAGLMAGCWIRVLWMTVGGMIFWLVLEESQKMIRNWTKNLVADK
ncbi:hypothetical protein T484DRAFT_1826684, partial [Baffinella frigidus]